MPDSSLKGWQEVAWPLLLWLLHSIGNLWWLMIDTRPPFSDVAGHAILALRVSTLPGRQMIMEGNFSDLLGAFGHYPPLVYLATIPFIKLFYPTIDVLTTIQIFFFGLLIFSTYGIGRLAVGRKAARLAAFLVSMYPLIYGLSRYYLIDLPLTAMTAFAIFCLFWSDSFRWRLPSLMLGVALGFGMLTKWTLAVFVLGPLLIALYLALRHPTRARLINVGMAGVVTLAIMLPFYLNNLEQLQAYLQLNRLVAAPLENDPAIWSWSSWLYYPRELLLQQLLAPFTLLFVVGIVLALRRCRLNAYLWMLLTWILFSYLISSLFINKDTRYTMPYLPAFALLTAIGLVQIRQVMVRRVGLLLIVLYALVQYLGLTVGLSSHVAGMPAYSRWMVGQIPLVWYAEGIHVVLPAHREDWQVDPILTTLLADREARNLDLPLDVLVIPTMNPFDAQAFTFAMWRDRLPVEISIITGILEIDSASVLERSDYVVTKSGDLGWEFALQDARALTEQLLDPASPVAAQFELIAEFPLPDGSTAFLFRHLREE